MEKLRLERMGERGKPIHPNVDFFSGAVYTLLGIPTVPFTPVFAVARVSGGLARIPEQRTDHRIYRPRSRYSGPAVRPIKPIASR